MDDDAPDPDACLAAPYAMWERPRLLEGSLALQRLRDGAEEDKTLIADLEPIPGGRIRKGWGLERVIVRENPTVLAEIAKRTGLVVRQLKSRGRGWPRSVVLGPLDDPGIK